VLCEDGSLRALAQESCIDVFTQPERRKTSNDQIAYILILEKINCASGPDRTETETIAFIISGARESIHEQPVPIIADHIPNESRSDNRTPCSS